MKVKVLVDYNDKNLGSLKKGDYVEMSEERFNYLSDKMANPYKAVLVEQVEEENENQDETSEDEEVSNEEETAKDEIIDNKENADLEENVDKQEEVVVETAKKEDEKETAVKRTTRKNK